MLKLKLSICLFTLLMFLSSESFAAPNFSYLVVKTGPGAPSVLKKENATKLRYPASLTKLMTLYLTFDALKHQKIRLDSTAPVSQHASAQPSMKIDLHPGEKVSVRTLINSMVVASANDSAVVLAEKLGGSEHGFVQMMNSKGQQLGMKNTHFANATGLYNSSQVTTAMDMARLMIAIKHDFPQYYSMLSSVHFNHNGVHYGPHTQLMIHYKWAKAAKTGFISQSGFNLVLNAKKNNEDLVAVVMGGRSARSRDHFMKLLLDNCFNPRSSRLV